MKRPAITVTDVTVRYQSSFESVVDHVSFSIEPAKMAMLIGPNGSGKTTLIKAMLGLIEYEGDIKIAGRDSDNSPHAIGYVPQTHTVDLSFPMTVAEFLHFSHTNCPDFVNRPEHIDKTLDLIGAKALYQKPINTLSGGQLQRVLLARAIMHQPKILILDEPEAGIDVGGEQTLYDLLKRLQTEQKITILVSTHEIDIVNLYADQVICLHHRLICDGRPQEVLTAETLKHLYGQHLHQEFINHVI